ncbi:cytochrome P450 93A3-like [Humulus lupulus]|uniref:cytochrome P450 93A3-like n=1 Tax=Humulus lupulus TaxID=3486 RepID=UPI002B4124B6|nr:cytochrome P450 93A3-like [Humulus lupulus]
MESFQGYTILFLVWLVSTMLVRAMLSKNRTMVRLPPSPFALPIIGHLHLLGPIPHQAFHKLSNSYGPLIYLSLGSVPCVVVSSPEIAKLFLKTHEAWFSNRPQLSVLEHLSYPLTDFTFAPHGPYWKFMKKLCMSRLLGGQTLNQLLPVRSEEIKRFLKLMGKSAESKEPVEVCKELTKLTNNTITRMIMGKRCSGDDDDNGRIEAENIKELVKERNQLVGRFNLSDFFWFCKTWDLLGFEKKGKGFHEKFDSMIEKIITEHEEARNVRKGRDDIQKDLLDILLDIAEDEDNKSDIRLGRDNIKAFILDIFVAGTGTSAITIEWALAELINHPNIMKKAIEEIDSIVGKARLVEESDIVDLPYIQAITKETLRLHPAGPLILRESTENCTINGYYIPKKTRVYINSWAIGRDLKYWENPLEFKPERFLSEDGSGIINHLDVRGQNFNLLPFGSGRRGCPGTSLALLIIQTSLACMIQCFEWRIFEGLNDKVDVEEGPGLTLVRAHPLICVPVSRFIP